MGLLAVAFLIVVFAAVVSYLASYSGRTPEVNAAGRTVLRVNRSYAVVVGVGTALTVLLLILMMLRPSQKAPLVPTVLGMALGCLAICVPVILAVARVRVEFDREVIRHQGIFGRVRELRWADVREVRFSKARLELALLSDTTRIAVNMHMIGFPKLVEMMQDRLEAGLIRSALVVIQTLKRKL